MEKVSEDSCKKGKTLGEVIGVGWEQKQLDGRTLVLEKGLIQV